MIVRYGYAAPIFAAPIFAASLIAAVVCTGATAAQAAPTQKAANQAPTNQAPANQAKPDPAGWVAPPATVPVDMPPLVPPPPIVAPAAKTDNLPFPKWSEFPVPPTDVPTVSEIAQRVKTQNDLNKAFNAKVNALVWDDFVPEAFAVKTRDAMNPEYSKPVDQAETQKEMRDILSHQVNPPPVVKD